MRMKKLPNIMLGIAGVCLVAGIAEGMRPGGWGLGVPLAAVFLGLFFVTKMMEKEAAKFDEEQRQRQKLAEQAEGTARHSSTH